MLYTDTMASGLLKEPVEKVCPECGVSFNTTSPVQNKCSAKCREAYKERRKRERRRQARKEARPWIICEVCSTRFQGLSTAVKYCSRECARDAVNQRNRKPRMWVSGQCTECEQWFIVNDRTNHTRVCSIKCRNKQDNRERSIALSERPCDECGAITSLEYGSRGQRFCTDYCRRKRKNKLKHSYGNGSHRKRARKYGVAYEWINHSKVYERDGWICGICRTPIDSTILWPDDQSKSIDHIIPLSKGGGHVWANVQAAHLGCNVDKGDAILKSGALEEY